MGSARVDIRRTGRARENVRVELYGSGSPRKGKHSKENPVEMSTGTIVAIVGLTAVTAGVLVYLFLRPTTTTTSVTAPAQPTGLGVMPPPMPRGLGALPYVATDQELAAAHLRVMERLVDARPVVDARSDPS